ncbi:hypothetical protein GOP47_0007299 [Adiantum capillus-veneris]|uniref:Uncharacterized protein n=1 Tax=Adiantum capillus-veneris TaxID=13818 RepID=A0A9D4V0F3_ADICA|nr:hypothetical protein GOP47_0007299 [Adiantum capillus-veneris]
MSLGELEDCVRRAFSDRLLVLHGLFSPPYPRGTHAKCQVDSKTVMGWQESDIQLVIQIVKSGSACSKRICDSEDLTTKIVEGDSSKDRINVNPRTEPAAGEDVSSEQESRKLQENIHGPTATFKISSNTEHGPCKTQIILGRDKQCIEQSVCEGNRACTCNQGQNLTTEVLFLLSFCDASLVETSFDAVINMLNASWITRTNFTSAYSHEQESCEKDQICFNKSGDTQDNLAFLLQRSKGKASHPNIVPVLGAFKSKDGLFLFYPAAPFTLENILHFSPQALDDDWNKRFLVYQLLSAIAYLHNSGIIHGDLKPSNILLTDQMWCWITGFHVNAFENSTKGTVDLCSSLKAGPDGDLSAKKPKPQTFSDDLQSAVRLWCKGELSNYDYLLILNKLAGRRWGDCKFHTVMPWVIDFSVKPEKLSDHGWRDLTKSKWRLAKGDEQLDFTYAMAEIPHHVSDECLSDLAVCIYKARRLPLSILRKTVRSVYEPNEYPASLQRLYQWTPDECIPEFYSDPSIFFSAHSGMSDLAIPYWAKDAEEFILIHREALEGHHVSDYLHHWIDLTFGYKLSGEAAIGAKNVTLVSTSPKLPRSQGRRQLFTLPHPKRQKAMPYNTPISNYRKHDESVSTDGAFKKNFDCKTKASVQMVKKYCPLHSLEIMEEIASFCQHLRHLSPVYASDKRNMMEKVQDKYTSRISDVSFEMYLQDMPTSCKHNFIEAKETSVAELLGALDVKISGEGTYQDFLLWQNTATQNSTSVEGAGCDIFAIGCIIAELYLGRPLFDPISMGEFEERGLEPTVLQQLPAHVQSLVRLMIDINPVRRICAARLLESPFFPPTVRTVHSFVSLLYLMDDQKSRLEVVARLASHGAFILMGSVAAKKCICFGLSSLVLPSENIPVQECIAFLNAALLSLKPHDAKTLLIPVIQHFLQCDRNNDLKIALLHVSFIKKIYKCIGKSSYLQLVHPVVLFALQQSTDAEIVAAASTLIIETCEELGVPITYFQTIGPLLQQFGRDIAICAIDTIVEIGNRLGECLVVKHLLPTLRAMIHVCLSAMPKEKTGPARSWHMLVVKDAIALLDRLLPFLPSTDVYFALVQEPHNVIESVLLDSAVDASLQQHAANTLLSVCQRIGEDAAAGYIVPRLQPLFVAACCYNFDASKDCGENSGFLSSCATLESVSHHQTISSADLDMSELSNADSKNAFNSLAKSKTQLDLLHSLYTGLASLLGIERLRRRLKTWLITEQILLKVYGWKWENNGVCQRDGDKSAEDHVSFAKPRAEFTSTSLLFNEIGWSLPQPAANKSKGSTMGENINEPSSGFETGHNGVSGSWAWLPVSEDCLDSTDYLSRPGLVLNAAKDERPWPVKATVSYAWRAHSGPLKAIAFGDGESSFFTAGVGTKMRGLVKQWQLSTTKAIMGYTGHEEVVNDVCILPWTQRVVSCDGSIHLWDAQTGKCAAVFSESSKTVARSSSSALIENNGMHSIGAAVTPGTATPGGMLFTGLHGSQYTCIHLMEAEQRLAAGTGSGHLRFFDLPSGQSLHIWRCDFDSSGSSLVSAITSAGKQSFMDGGCVVSSPWIAVGFGTGLCRLMDLRLGNFVASWRAHESFITKLAAFEGHYLVSSSLDKTLCLWDLRRNVTAKLQTFHGHSYGVSSFEIWGNNLLSTGGNKIGISAIPHPSSEVLSSLYLEKKARLHVAETSEMWS